MCGICGIIKFTQLPVQKCKLEVMMKKMKHRGPDDEGLFLENNIGLGFVRLSIIDLSPSGHQPMFGGERVKTSLYKERYVIVYNGEVYNYIRIA